MNTRWGIIYLAIITSALISGSLAEMPLGFYRAMDNGGQREVLSIRNYETGASFTEDYTDLEHLERNTEVSTRSSADPSTAGGGSGTLEASINSNVIGKAHIAWQSVDQESAGSHGRHPLMGRSIEDLTGVFSIDKFIQLWSDSRPGEVSVDWLPCS
ncbi:MAG: hypothetical protein A4E48_01861 [Methanosaeta sp. PtaU1.Bin060]|nr:MAG: hypothetical protein A4E48_01861 [Methanosaeta sp. PtaU1.Bin060]